MMEKDNKINNAFAETYDIVCHLEKSSYDKIPKKFLEFMKKNMNPNYSVNIDYSKDINSQILYDTKVVMGLIYRDYLVDADTQKEFKEKDKKEIEQKYDIENIFKERNKVSEVSQENDIIENNKSMVVYKKNSFSRIIEKIKIFFRRS